MHHLRAAEGWIELGNHAEAKLELEMLPRQTWSHPEVLKVRWAIHAAEKNWAAALDVATALTETQPDELQGWVHRSYCLHELKRTGEARDNLLRVVGEFPVSATVHYNLACYESQLGDLAKARDWLAKAFRIGGRRQMLAAALADPDLKPLWEELRSGRI
jgi:Flp pilus assembly protein TadD